jgi:di/tricarboxylate transporter
MLPLAILSSSSNKTSVWEKLQTVPTATWVSLGITILVLFVLVRMWKALREINEFVPWIVLILVGGSVILYWTYERTEPKLLSPVMDFLAQYLPSKIQYKEADVPR